MILKVAIDEQLYELNVPDELLQQGQDFFAQMDRDMDLGWQMSREWVDQPSLEQRLQIVGDKLLTALEKENHKLGRLMAGYILSRQPLVETLELDTSGEMQNTRILLREGGDPAPRPAPHPVAAATTGMGKMAALEQAGNDVTKVFRSGRHWQFSVFDHAAGRWDNSPAVADKDEAERLRQEAFRRRYEELVRG